MSKNVLCNDCTYVQKDINKSDENFDSTQDNEPNFSSSYFHEEPIVNVESIEERLRVINLHRVQKKGGKLSFQEYDKDRTVQHKKKKGTRPKISSPAKMDTSEAEFLDETSPIEKE